MGSALTTLGLPLALGIIMLGLGLTLTPADFARVVKHPKAVVIALVCQLIVLPALCFALVLVFKLPPILAIGMMLLAASPGGTTANLYSHLFRGDVALNISLTAVNSVLAVVTLPVITNLAIGYFAPDQPGLGLQVAKALEVFAIVLGPVAIGMIVRRVKPAFADAMDKPVRIASVVILAVVIAGAVAANFELLRAHVSSLATITVCLPLAGGNVLRPAAAFPGDARAARGFNGDIGMRLTRWRSGSPPARSVARKTLFAAAGVVSVLSRTWTTDRRDAARLWADLEPGRAPELAALVPWAEGEQEPRASELAGALSPRGIVASVVEQFESAIGLWP